MKFRPKLIPTAGVLIIAPLFAALGLWQQDRAQQKLDIQQLYEARLELPQVSVGAALENPQLMQYRSVRAAGSWDGEHEFLVDNKILNGTPGFHVITPLVFRGSATGVLVNRGWIPGSPDRSNLPDIPDVHGSAAITGIAAIPPENPFVLKQELPLDEGSWELIWQTLNLKRFDEAVDYQIQGFVIRLNENHKDGFERQWQPPQDEWIYRHKAYAFQWFALCAGVLVIYLAFAFRPQKKPDSHP